MSQRIRAIVHRVLHNPTSSKAAKTARGSALTQRDERLQTVGLIDYSHAGSAK